MAFLWTNGRWEISTDTHGLTLWRHSTHSRPPRWVTELTNAETVTVVEFLAARGVPAEEWLTDEALAMLRPE